MAFVPFVLGLLLLTVVGAMLMRHPRPLSA
jgi:hypothetical protein